MLPFSFHPHSEPGSKHVLWVSLPTVTESAGAHKCSITKHGAHHSYSIHTKNADWAIILVARGLPVSELKKIEHAYPCHLIILASLLCQDDLAPALLPSAPIGGILAY